MILGVVEHLSKLAEGGGRFVSKMTNRLATVFCIEKDQELENKST